MRKERVRINYGNLSDYQLATLAGRVLKAMKDAETANHFNEPRPTIDELEELVNDYITKHEIASNGGSVLEVSQKDESRALVLDALRTLGGYVNEVARDRMSLLLSTGLKLASQPEEKGLPGVVSQIKLSDGPLSGHIKMSFKAIKEAVYYEIEIGDRLDESNEVNWKQSVETTSSRNNYITDLNPGTKYYIRVRARSRRGWGDWSETVTWMVR